MIFATSSDILLALFAIRAAATSVQGTASTNILGETYSFRNSTNSVSKTAGASLGSNIATTKNTQTSNFTSSGTGLVATTSRSSRSATSISGFPLTSINATRTGHTITRSSSLSSFTHSTIQETAPSGSSLNATGHGTTSSKSKTPSASSSLTIGPSSHLSESLNSSVHSHSSLSMNSSGVHTSNPSNTFSAISKTVKDPGQTTTNSAVPTDLGPSILTKTVVETGSSGVFTTVIPVLSGGDITSAIPITATAVGWLDPSGIEASSSAASIQSQIVLLVPIIKSYIDTPNKPKATDTINSINKVRSSVDNLLSDLDSSDSKSNKPCSVSTNLITDLFNAVKCTADNLKKAADDIENEIDDNFEDLSEIESTLENIQGLEDGLDEDNKQKESISQKSVSKTSTSNSPSSTRSCTSSSITEDLYVECFSTPAPGRTRQAAASCATSTKTISGCDLTAITTTSFASCTAVQTASDCLVMCVTQLPGSFTTHKSQSCSTTCFSTVRGCQATGVTSTTTETEAAACSLPPKTTSAPIQGPIYTAWWDWGIFCAGPDCSNYTSIPTSVITPSGTYVTNITSTSSPTNTVTTSGSIISKSGTSSHLPPNTRTTPVSITSRSFTSSQLTSSKSHISESTTPTTSPSPSLTTSTASTSTSLSCAPTINSAVPSGIAQSDMQDAVIDYCGYISHTKGLTDTNDALPYYEPGGIVRLNFTSQFNITQAICNDALGTVVNGCPPLSVPSGQALDKWGGTFFIKNETGGTAEFQIAVEAAVAIS